MTTVARRFLGSVLIASVVGGVTVARAASSRTWVWPTVGPVLRIYDPPATTYGAGHRGIDIACARGAPIVAVASGLVTFAGSVGGQRYVTVDHGTGLSSTYSYLDVVLTRKGATVVAGTAVGTCGAGHAGATIPHVHLGAKRPDGSYEDPLLLLIPADLTSFVHLAPQR